MQKAGEDPVRFNLRRTANFFRLLLGNRSAALGLIILVASAAIALSAPSILPNDPQKTVVGAPIAEPEWVTYFPEGYYLSKDLVVVRDPAFNSPNAVQDWSYTFDQASLASVSVAYSSVVPQGPYGGSLEVSSSSSQAVNVTVYRNFHYPYHGAPSKIFDDPHIEAKIAQVAGSKPISLRFFLDRYVNGEKVRSFTLWSTLISDGRVWSYPKQTIDSSATDFGDTIGIPASGVGPLQVMFPSSGDYVLGVQLGFPGPGKIDLTGLGLTLYGNAHGILGTDYAGADILAQNLWGSRISLYVGLLAAFIGIGLGLIVGLIAGYKTGLTDEALMRFTDMMLVIPGLPLLIVLVAVLGASINNLILVIGFLGWMGFARVVRSQVLTLKERPFVEAAKAAGAGTGHILSKHVFPNIVSLTYVNLALSVPVAILTEAALSFLGLGDPNVTSWGHIIYNAEANATTTDWWIVIPPGLAIAVVSLSFVLMGYALDEIFNPKLRRRR